ncbi:MAG: DUF1737 domain-containing protein [Bacteroidota bacterium]
MKRLLRQYMLLFVGAGLGFAFFYLLSQTPLQAQPEDLSASRSYTVVSKEFWEAKQEESLVEFSGQVDEKLREGWRCLGAPVLLARGANIGPTTIMQAMIKE